MTFWFCNRDARVLACATRLSWPVELGQASYHDTHGIGRAQIAPPLQRVVVDLDQLPDLVHRPILESMVCGGELVKDPDADSKDEAPTWMNDATANAVGR